MLEQQELDDLRTEQEKWMTARGIIRRRQAMGGGEWEYGVIARDVPGRLKAGFGFFRPSADRFQGINAFILTVRWNQDIEVGDQWLDEAGITYEIRDVRKGSTILTAIQCLADRINDGS